MAAVSIAGVNKSFGATPIIHGVSIDIQDGEFVILVGPSGCGKSTLLRMIAGLENISGGEIRIGPRVVNDVPPKERDIAMVFQNYALYPHMTVADNMAFSLKLRKAPKSEIEGRVGKAASILGLEKLLDRYPRQLSGGQRQRVAMRTEIKELHQRLKTTTVYVTHDQIEAMTMADKIVVMHDGIVEQMGAPLDLYDRPDNLFVAGFIGSPAMNLVRGRVEGGQFRANSGFLLPLPVAARAALDGRPAVYGVRPEHFALASGNGAGGVPVQVVVVEPTGSETQVVVRGLGASADASTAAHQDVVCVFRERIAARPGETIHVVPDAAKVHLFDAGSGKRLVGQRPVH